MSQGSRSLDGKNACLTSWTDRELLLMNPASEVHSYKQGG
jgi:hypothetical protein